MATSGAIFDIKLEGFEQVEKNLKALPLALQRKVLRPAMRDGAKLLKVYMQAAAPSPGRTGKGRLRQKIRIKAMRRDRSRRGRIGFVVITGKRDELGIPAKSKGYYPAHLALGWETASGRRVPGVNWARNALRAGEAAVRSTIATSLEQRMVALSGLDDAKAFNEEAGVDFEVIE